MLRALGFRFLDGMGAELIGGGEVLGGIGSVEDSPVCAELRSAPSGRQNPGQRCL